METLLLHLSGVLLAAVGLATLLRRAQKRRLLRGLGVVGEMAKVINLQLDLPFVRFRTMGDETALGYVFGFPIAIQSFIPSHSRLELDNDLAYSVEYYTQVWKRPDDAKAVWQRSMLLAKENGDKWQAGLKLAWEDAHDMTYKSLPPGRLISYLANQALQGGVLCPSESKNPSP